MIYVIVNKESLEVKQKYESEFVKETSQYWDYSLAEPLCAHIPAPEGLDADCLIAQHNGETVELIEDQVLVAAKAVKAKEAQIAELKAICNADIEAKQIEVYGTANQSAALATQQSWSDIESYTQEYVPLMFPTLDAANEYIVPKMLAARQFAAWRFNRIAQRDTAIALL